MALILDRLVSSVIESTFKQTEHSRFPTNISPWQMQRHVNSAYLGNNPINGGVYWINHDTKRESNGVGTGKFENTTDLS